MSFSEGQGQRQQQGRTIKRITLIGRIASAARRGMHAEVMTVNGARRNPLIPLYPHHRSSRLLILLLILPLTLSRFWNTSGPLASDGSSPDSTQHRAHDSH
jgi:hypothetical protein